MNLKVLSVRGRVLFYFIILLESVQSYFATASFALQILRPPLVVFPWRQVCWFIYALFHIAYGMYCLFICAFCTDKEFERRLKPGSHERHKHKQRKQSMTSPPGLAKTKQQEFFFVSPFDLLLAYAWTMMLMTILMSQTWLHSFVLPFVLPLCLCLCYRVKQT